MDRFYNNIPACAELEELMEGRHFVALPDDWYVVITDIVDSTEALRKGRYKAVNAAGASVIMAILNLTRPIEVPFVFGGDGASICIPPAFRDKVNEALLALKTTIRQSFSLEMRVGIIPYDVIRDAGHEIKVARYRVSDHYHQAFINGGGLSYSEYLLKDDEERAKYIIADDVPVAHVNLRGLECRWDTVPSPHGETIALLVKVVRGTRDDQNRLYGDILHAIDRIFGGRDQYNPLRTHSLGLTYNLRKLSVETGLRAAGRGWFGRAAYKLKIIWENLLGDILMGTDSHAADINWGEYRSDLVDNSDYMKFDDMLRLIIAGDRSQRMELSSYLEYKRGQGDIIYGMHVSEASLITCLVFEREKNHIHFIDAEQGGYAMAALQMKNQAVRDKR
jgi:hypothetical protein